MAKPQKITNIGPSNLKDAPDEDWSNATIGALNDAIVNNNLSPDNIEFKSADITVPNPWFDLTLVNGWTGTLKCAKLYDGSVELVGSLTPGAYGANCTTLTSECWPIRNINSIQNTGAAPNYGQFAITTAGVVTPVTGAGTMEVHIRFMPASNVPKPLDCFPVRLKTRFKAPPKAVIAIRSRRSNNDNRQELCAPMLPSWSFIRGSEGPVILINDIQGLEYDCRQVVDFIIIGGK